MMSSLYYVNLNEEIETAENKVEKLKNTDVLIYGPEDFKAHFLGYLKLRELTPISKDYNYQETNPSIVQVLAEQEASFCTLILAFNEEGEGFLVHESFADIQQNGKLPSNTKRY